MSFFFLYFLLGLPLLRMRGVKCLGDLGLGQVFWKNKRATPAVGLDTRVTEEAKRNEGLD